MNTVAHEEVKQTKPIGPNKRRLDEAVINALGRVGLYHLRHHTDAAKRRMVLKHVSKNNPKRLPIGSMRHVAKSEFWALLETDPGKAKKLAEELEDVKGIRDEICRHWPSALQKKNPRKAAEEIAEAGLFGKLANRKAVMLRRMAEEARGSPNLGKAKELVEIAERIESVFELGSKK